MSKQPTMEDFFKAFDKALFDCIDNGTEFSMSLAVGERVVEVKIHEAGKARADFDDMILKASKDAKIMNKGGM